MSEKSGNLFTHRNIQEVVDILKVDPGDGDQHEAVFQSKITAMQRLLRFGMSKFSKDRLYQHLSVVARRVSVQEKGKTRSNQVSSRLRSMGHLKTVIQNLRVKEKFGGLLESEKQTLKYFDNFFVDVEYVKRFKETFDSEVHTRLYYDYFKPSETNQTSPQKKGTKDKKTLEKDKPNYSLSEKEGKQSKKMCKVPQKGFPPHRRKSLRSSRSPKNKHEDALSSVGFSCSQHLDGSEYEKLHVTVRELQAVSERWGRMLLDEHQDLHDYDPESYYEVMESTGYAQFEILFRLFPDIFAKCYKIIELSKQWWSLAHKIYKKLPLNRPVSGVRPIQSVKSTCTDAVVTTTENAEQQTDIGAQKGTVSETKCHSESKQKVQAEAGTNNYLETEKKPQLKTDKEQKPHIKPTNRTETDRKNQLQTETKIQERTMKKAAQVPDNKDESVQEIKGNTFAVMETSEGHAGHLPQVKEEKELKYTRATDSRDRTPYTHETNMKKRERIRNIKARLFDLSYAIRECTDDLEENRLVVMKLEYRERRFQMLQILSGKVHANLEDIQETCRKTRAQRKVVAQRYSHTLRGTEEYFDYRGRLRGLDKQLMKYDQGTQLLLYKQGVVTQDLMLEMEIRPNFIRSYDDLRRNITEKEDMLHVWRLEQKDLEEELQLLEPDGIAGRSRRSENGSNSGYSVASCHLKDTTQCSTAEERLSAGRHTSSRTSGEYVEVLNDLGKQFELVNSAPPVHTELNDTKTRERTTFTIAPNPFTGLILNGAMPIEDSAVRFKGKTNFSFPHPPTYGRKGTRKSISGKVKPSW